MNSKLISLFLFILSSITLFLWWQFNYNTRQLEKNISELDHEIISLEEKNKVLLSEYAGHTNPIYLKKMASIYLDYDELEKNKVFIIGKNKFIDKINEINLLSNVSSTKTTSNYIINNN